GAVTDPALAAAFPLEPWAIQTPPGAGKGPQKGASSFPVGSRVTFSCSGGARRIPGMPDTVECLPGDIWSRLAEPCGRSCAAPTRLRFAALSKEDERRNFFPVGTNVSYVCRPGYENSSEISPSSTCLENLTWSQPAELCRSEYSCLITCPPPPPISHGRHDGEGIEIFAYNSTVTYSCEPNFQLVGNGSIQCGSRDKTSGVWSGATPECKGAFIPVQCPLLLCVTEHCPTTPPSPGPQVPDTTAVL
uniref:Sushi domain-containing protein n=1 Tax=Zonotrichia albicollis TaxID=44394 RepID=A0A8D2MSR4_ZONAL